MTPPTERPLAGRTVLLTRPAGRVSGLVARLARLGAKVEAWPTIRLEAPADERPAREAVARLSEHSWIVFTSANGVRAFARFAREEGRELRPFPARVAAVGPATAAELALLGIDVEVLAQESSGVGLARALGPRIVGNERLLLVQPEVARPELPRALAAAGARVDAVAFYRNVPAPELPRIARALVAGRFDIVVFSAPSTFERLLGAPVTGIREALVGVDRVAIGPTTAKALAAAGLPADAVATEPSESALVAAVLSLDAAAG